MQEPPVSPHDRFFSSLKQVEDRMLSEGNTGVIVRRNPSQNSIYSDPLSSPLFLNHLRQPNTSSSPRQELEGDSNPPFSGDEDGNNNNDNSSSRQKGLEEDEFGEGGEIQRLISLLGLSQKDDVGSCEDSCRCSGGGFYKKIAGMKGPKCKKEMRRLDAWIDYYLSSAEEEKEPARLAHLILAKAASLGGAGGFRGIGFPETVEGYLEHDPPKPS